MSLLRGKKGDRHPRTIMITVLWDHGGESIHSLFDNFNKVDTRRVTVA